MNIFEIILALIGVALIIFAFMLKTKNVVSTIVFNVFPFISGCYCIFFAILTSGIIKINN